MSLVPQQQAFLSDVLALIARAGELDFVVTGGELYRTVDQQRIHIRAGRSRTMNSQHMKRLAIDLNFFVRSGGELRLCYDKSVLQDLGDYWESLSPANRWGGNWSSFKDTPHFERREAAEAVPDPAPGPARDHPVPSRPALPAAGAAEPAAWRSVLDASVGAKCRNRRDDVETVQRLCNHAREAGRLSLAEALVPDGIFGLKTAAAIEAVQQQMAGVEPPDGIVDPGGQTERVLRQALPQGFSRVMLGLLMLRASEEAIAEFHEPICRCFESFAIAEPLQQAHFLAQIGHESGELRFREEIASGQAYEGRSDLGNVFRGDGPRFKGRGLIQLTGRANYTEFGTAIGRCDEVLASPGLVAQELDLCVGAAGWYWKTRGLNELAARDDVGTVTKRINGGHNGLSDRTRLLRRAKALLGLP